MSNITGIRDVCQTFNNTVSSTGAENIGIKTCKSIGVIVYVRKSLFHKAS